MISTRRRFPRALPLAVLLSLWPISSRANPYELFGFTPRETALSGSEGATGDDLASIFYNPAGMIGHTKTEFGLGVQDSFMNLHIDRLSPSTVPTGYEDDAPRVEFGLIFPLGGAVMKDHVVVGLTFGTPIGSLIRVQTVDQSKPQFYMYQSKPQRFAAAGSIAIKIVDGLSIGIGGQVIAEQIASVDFAIDLGDIGKLVLDVAGYAQYWPHVFSLGTTVKPTRRLSVAFQLDYLLWGSAPNDQVQVQISPSGPVLDGLGLSSVLGFASADARMGFSNIFTPRVGVEYAATDWLTVRGGAYVRPPITPDQTGSTNYLDNFTENFSAGATVKFDDPLRVFTEPVHFDLGAALLVANDRTTIKAQAVDATGNYTYGGSIFSIGAMLRYLY